MAAGTMNKKNFLRIIGGLGAGFGFCLLLANDNFFILKKKSTADVKEECCNYITDTLKQTPETLFKIAKIQEIAMVIMEAMLAGTFFGDAKKTELSQDELECK